jgi:LPXTG-motif cell wall-anchored protein
LPITGIPLGTECTVTETVTGGADDVTYTVNGGSPSGDPPTVTIETEGQTITVTVTNTFLGEDEGILDVVKVVAGDGEPEPGTEFTIEVDCDGDEFDETLVFDEDGNLASGTTPITGIPLGTDCTVTETDDGDAELVIYDPNGGSPSDPPTVEITTEGETVTVTVTNVFEDDDDDDDGDGDGDDGDGDDGDDGDDEDASLPSTGSSADSLLEAGLWLVVLGAALLIMARRREDNNEAVSAQHRR